MVMKATIYARYSSDKQSETSLDDQLRVCRARADREGATVEFERCDAAISGSTAVGTRPAGNAMLADALAGRFDLLLVEGLDRLARDQVEQEQIVRRLEHRGIRIIGVSDGYDSRHSGRKIMRGVRGLINDLYLDDLRSKTHRGQAGQVERGYIAGGKSYGYDIVKADGGSTYKINESQARWVVWILEQYAAGNSVQRIAHELNNQGVSSPRDSTWAVSTIYGSPVKGSAGYVAIERVTGRVHGREGSFALQHFGVMNRGASSLTLSVLPDSGIGELAGLSGTMSIDIRDGQHFYAFDYSLDPVAQA